ncbi:MAG: hypothetical protein JWN17_399 [Frankiales bacterium]|nr:hypothetical protein [Frankiales bacterium]
MGQTVPVRRPSWTPGSQRTVLLAGLVLPLVAVAALYLRPSGEVLQTVDLPQVAAAPAAAALPFAEPDGTTERFSSAGRARAALVQDPLAGQRARGVVIVLSPHSLTAARTATDVRFDELRSRGYAIAYPSTLDGDWNAGRCCGTSQRTGVDDVRFLQDLRGRLLEQYGLTGRQVGLVGYSTGGQMAYRTVCEHPTFARAVVIVAGSLETPCHPDHALPPTLVVHGLEDSTIPWAVTVRRTQLLDYSPTPALSSVGAYARAAGCGRRVLDRSDGRWLMGWPDCDRIPLLSAVGMPGTGHGWTPLGGSVYATRFLPQHLESP